MKRVHVEVEVTRRTSICSGLQTAARGLANNVAFEPTIRAKMMGCEPTLTANEPTFGSCALLVIRGS